MLNKSYIDNIQEGLNVNYGFIKYSYTYYTSSESTLDFEDSFDER